ncbi:DASH complex subunit ask1 [Lunasporangiospora selenospora]|uniref:DASH complex subunit ASK1 n=1 Tax=Lunasporangiospora selenospora TaxID=979761 RepID=A0A9P6FV84_9FUNG|nr:DASH complex subunit ask1 [Lunasporangiospora selenospora]
MSSIASLSTANVLDEIERLEQSITRALQEIDQSFSDCHSIVSSKILPQIDRYAESSREVWEHARLWLNFFEAASSTSTSQNGEPQRTTPQHPASSTGSNNSDSAIRNPALSSSFSPSGRNSLAVEQSIQRRHSDMLDNSTNRQRIL